MVFFFIAEKIYHCYLIRDYLCNKAVRRRKDTGKWVCDFYYNGERIVKTLKFARTKKEAESAEAVIMNQVFQQAYGFDAKPDKRFEDFVIETFLP